MEAAGSKRPQRTNAGKIQHYGNPVDHSKKSMKTKKDDQGSIRKSRSSKSTRTGSGRTVKSIQNLQKDVDDEMEDQIDELENEFLEIQTQIKLLVIDKDALLPKIQKLEKEREEAVTNAAGEDAIKALDAQIQTHKDDLDTFIQDIARGQTRECAAKLKMDRKKKELLRKAEAQKRRIEEEQTDDTEISDNDFEDTVQRWDDGSQYTVLPQENFDNDHGMSHFTNYERRPYGTLIDDAWTPSPISPEFPFGYGFDYNPQQPSSSSFCPPQPPPFPSQLRQFPKVPTHVKPPVVPVSTPATTHVVTTSATVTPVISTSAATHITMATTDTNTPPPIVTMAGGIPATATSRARAQGIPTGATGGSAPPPPHGIPTGASAPTPHGFPTGARAQPPSTPAFPSSYPYGRGTPAASSFQFQNMYQALPPLMSVQDKMMARQIHGGDLPIFSGRPEQWPQFVLAFNNSTKLCQFTDEENLPRLRKCLKNEAYRMVEGWLYTPNSVKTVFENLKMRFGRPEQIIKYMTDKVRVLQPVRMDKFDSIVDFGIAVNNLCQTITSLNSNEYLYSPILLDELVKKLPPSSQIEWASQDCDTPRLDIFATWLQRFTKAACKLCPPPSYDDNRQQDRGRRNQPQHRVLNTEEVKNNNEKKWEERKEQVKSRGKAQRRNCPCCLKSDHFKVVVCPVFLQESVDGRWKIAMSKRFCFGCLNLNHSFNECRSKKQCNLDGCKELHHNLLHHKKLEVTKKTPPAITEGQQKPQDFVNFVQELYFILLMVLPVELEGPNGTVSTFMFLDNGATLTMLDESLAEQLGLIGDTTSVRVAGFKAPPKTLTSRIVNFKIKSTSGDFSLEMKNVKTVESLDLRSQSVRKSLIQKWSHLQGIHLDTYDNKKPGILVGSDFPQLHQQLDYRVGPGNAPVAIKTPLGWALQGRTSWNSREQFGYHIQELQDDPLHQLVKEQFTTEAFGTMPLVQKPRSKEDIRAQLILDSTLKRVEGGWETGLLWREDNVTLPKSRPKALVRLFGVERKMDRDQVYAKAYVDKIDEYKQKGFARVLSKEEAQVETNKTNYLSHFMNFNPKKPGKLRFVFDAADKIEGRSLNDHLLPGPDKLKNLPGVLLRFRQRKVGLTGDIKDMFHRVKVKPEDAQAQRFLWRGMDRNREPDTLEMTVLIFGATCSPTCAQEAKNKNAEEFRDEFPEAYEAIVNRHYVDDYLDSCDTSEDSIRRYEDVRRIQLKGGFNICNWLSSSPEVMQHIPGDLRAKNMKSLDFAGDNVVERVLGLFWKPDSDTFTFSMSYLRASDEIINGFKIPTKRQTLSLVMSINDPLGFLAVLTVKARIILQLIWRSKVGWDDEITQDIFIAWKRWLMEMKKIPLFSLQRCYSTHFSNADEIQLHIFADGSEEAFGAVAYFRIEKDGGVETALVMAKAKVAPLKTISIPRMELQAAVLGCRMALYLHQEIEIKINRTVFWSDSQTVLDWIRSDSKRFQVFVSQRIGEIQELSEVAQWKWIPTLQNVADELTRLNSPCDFQPGSRWLTGPSFLPLSEDQWPQERRNLQVDKNPDALMEMKKGNIFHIEEITPTIDISRFSSWMKLIRVTVIVFRVINKMKKKSVHKGRWMFPKELKFAEDWWCHTSQQESFPEDFVALKDGEGVSKSSRLRKLSPYMEDNIIRICGRIDNAALVPVAVRRPAILDPKHPYTKLLLSHFHLICGHIGQERIVNEIRQQFHILHLRAAVKKAQAECQKCKNERVKPCTPEMGQLPSFRLEPFVAPFNKTGMDYFGPIEVNVNRSKVKRYGVIFTCLSTRAIHLEIAGSLSTDSCIMAIRRFVGRRGCPTHIYSDNGTNFHGTNNELQKALKELDEDKLTTECGQRGISWHFNPPAAPHMGGSWERMVRSVKTACGATLKIKNLSDEVLYTLMVEVEHTVNSHPLTHVPCDPNDPEALTPNHFLIGRSSNLQPLGEFTDSDLYGRKQWRIVQLLANHFWKRWIREFLPTLVRREKWCQPARPIQVGDVVIEVNEALDRNQWPKGIIIKLFPGKDGITRVVDVKMGNGHIYRRPVAKLCILDVRPDSPKEPNDK